MMRYGSVCSGIEAATVAWHPLGWQPAFFSEIEPFPCRVLQRHYPKVPNHGDMTKFQEWPGHAIDLLVGGTPCQSFSVAGLRQGLADPRGNLMLTFGAVARRYEPRWIMWENVPGVLSSDGGRDFGTFLGMLAELGYGIAYRVLDAQYVRVDGFGRAVPQRRRRVFVVGYSGDWRRAAAVLFEPESLRRNTAPRREAGKAVAPTIAARTRGGGGLGTDFDCDGGLIASDVSPTMRAGGNRTGGDRPMGMDVDTCDSLVAHTLRGEGFDATEDGTGRGTPIVPVVHATHDTVGTLCAEDSPHGGRGLTALQTMLSGYIQPVAIQERAIAENAAAGPDGKGWRDDGAAYTLEARQVPQAVAFAQNQRDEVRTMDVAGAFAAEPGAKQQTYLAQPYTITQRGRSGEQSLEYRNDGTANAILTPKGGRGGMGVGAIAHEQWAVRRLTPTECERLQGFPDGYTDIGNGKGGPTPDGPRYKALGNSMAVNVMRWIGQRIDMVERLSSDTEAA